MILGKKKFSVQCLKTYKKEIFLSVVLVISILTACVGFLIITRRPSAEPTLRFVSIIHRHGERAPEATYHLDPYQGESFWPEGLGALLQRGKVSMFNLGRFLRHRYGGFLSPSYSATEVFVLSSRVDRCIMSVELLLAGLFPPVGIQIWNPDLLWQPIPVHSDIHRSDDKIRVSKHCTLLSKERKQREALMQKEVDKHVELLSYLSNKTGLEVKTIDEIYDIYDNLKVVEEQGMPLPQWVEADVQDKLKSLALMDILGVFKSPIMIKLQSGVLINEILSNMEQKTNTTNNFDQRLSLYSAHDSTLVRLWRGMNITQDITEVSYGAALIIELHQIKNNYRVKILYKRNNSDEELEVLKVKGCENDRYDNMCDLDSFSSALQSTIITNFDEACQNSKQIAPTKSFT